MRLLRIELPRGAALALVCWALTCAPALAAREQPVGVTGAPTTQPGGSVSGHLIVEWEPGTARADRADARDQADAGFVRTLGDDRFQLLRVEPGQTVADALDTLDADPAVRAVARDSRAVVSSLPNDPLFASEWGLNNVGSGIDGFANPLVGADIHVVGAWDRTIGTPSTVIADIDSGYRFDHPDLAGVVWTNPHEIPGNHVDDDGNGFVDDVHGWDFAGPDGDVPYAGDNDPTDDDVLTGGHGVHTAGTMAAAGDNGTGISGVARDVRIMPLRACTHSDQDGAATCTESAQIAAINYAGRNGARAANMSFGGGSFNVLVRDALAANPQTLFVIAAGNNGRSNDAPSTPTFPCNYNPSTSPVAGAIDNVICVAATDQADHLASFSNYGPTSVDLGAPGTETLSTYVDFDFDEVHREDFETNNFNAQWTDTGANGGFDRTNESPLDSFGMSDSPGQSTPTPNTVHESTSVGFSLPSGYSGCTLTQTRVLSLASVASGSAYTYSILLNDSSIASFSPRQSGTFSLAFSDPSLHSGGTIKLRFRYASGSSPNSGNGVWLDDLVVECSKPSASNLTYTFLQGTSMAAPHVTGAAALLFSLKPSASVAEVRAALLGTVDPLPTLAGKTVTGGRLDVSAALDRLVPPDTAVTSGPPPKTTSRSAVFAFGRADGPVAATFECSLDAAPFAACASPASYTVALGAHTFAVRARDAHGNVDASPASYAWQVTHVCKVPKLKGKTLRQARKALRRAHCAVGKVVKPKHRKGHRLPPLVVRSTTPKAGKHLAEGTKVRLRLAKKPPRHARHHR